KTPIHARIRCAALLIARADRWTHQLDKQADREELDAHGPEAHATPPKPRQKTTNHDTPAAHATSSVQKPRQKTTHPDTRTQVEKKIAVPPPVFEPVQAIADNAESIVASLAGSEPQR